MSFNQVLWASFEVNLKFSTSPHLPNVSQGSLIPLQISCLLRGKHVTKHNEQNQRSFPRGMQWRKKMVSIHLWVTKSFTNSESPHFQNEARCKTFMLKWVLLQFSWQIISLSQPLHLPLFWIQGLGHFGIEMAYWETSNALAWLLRLRHRGDWHVPLI